MSKKQYWKILLIVLLSMDNLNAKSEILDWKVLRNDKFNVSRITSVDLLIDNDNKVFVEVYVPGDHWLNVPNVNSEWVSTQQYGGCLNGFVKGGYVHLVFLRNKQYLDIYTFDKEIKLEKSITITDFPTYPGLDQVIYVPDENNAYYLLGSREQLPRNPMEFMNDILSGGHGLIYDKPVLAEIRDQTLLKYRRIHYGGKTDEACRIKAVLTGQNKIHFFCLRTQKGCGRSFRGKLVTPEVLHYAEYNTKKKKAVRTQDIYEELPNFEKSDKPRNLYLERSLYWHISADNFNEELFIVFSWQGFRFSENPDRLPMINMENIDTPIYYSQRTGATFDKAEMIGKGILPLVRADSLGNVHVIWSNSNGDLIHRMKKDGIWAEKQIVLDGVIDTNEVWEEMHTYTMWLRNLSGRFDKDNNLNMVFLSKGKLVYAKIKFDE